MGLTSKLLSKNRKGENFIDIPPFVYVYKLICNFFPRDVSFSIMNFDSVDVVMLVHGRLERRPRNMYRFVNVEEG